MLFKEIDSVTKEIDKLTTAKKNVNNQAAESKMNDGFFKYYESLEITLKSYITARDRMNFEISEITNQKLTELLNLFKICFDKKHCDNLYSISGKINELENTIKVEWHSYSKKELGIVSNMEVLKIISENKIRLNGIIIGLNELKKWPVTTGNLDVYEKALINANKEVNSRQFSEEIKEFLIKVQNKSATLGDLNEKVLNWIKEEHLEKKIGLFIVSA